MTHDDIIQWQLEQLQSVSPSPMSAAMLDFVNEHPDLKAQLDTLNAFGRADDPLPMPSDSMRMKFYESLANLQQSANSDLASVHANRKTHKTGVNNKTGLLQAAIFATVFLTGVYTGTVYHKDDAQALAALQSEVTTLNTIVAVSLLRQDNASQRLAGLKHTYSANQTDPILVETLLTTFATETSVSVKLAMVNAFSNLKYYTQLEESLISAAVKETTPLVQIKLIQLIFNKASNDSKMKLLDRLQARPLSQDVTDFIHNLNTQNRT